MYDLACVTDTSNFSLSVVQAESGGGGENKLPFSHSKLLESGSDLFRRSSGFSYFVIARALPKPREGKSVQDERMEDTHRKASCLLNSGPCRGRNNDVPSRTFLLGKTHSEGAVGFINTS